MREKIKQNLKATILDCFEQTGELLTFNEIKAWLEDEYGLGDEAEEFVYSLF